MSKEAKDIGGELPYVAQDLRAIVKYSPGQEEAVGEVKEHTNFSKNVLCLPLLPPNTLKKGPIM